MNGTKLQCAALKQITPQDRIFQTGVKICRTATIPTSLAKCRETGRLEAFKLNWQEGMPGRPDRYWDSDVAKVLEGMAYMLAIHPDADMEAEYDALIDLIVSAQQPDGYLNTYFTVVEPEQRWENLCANHELYCAGHLIEAAVAGYEQLGKEKLLKAMCRYAGYIGQIFGRGPGQKRGVPGHEEIEFALVRLYRATGERRYLELARYFIDERGASPNYFSEVEKHTLFNGPVYQQAHRPLREQREAEGHSVRAVYLYCGAAAAAGLTGDEELFHCCETLLDDIMNRKSYLTGGIGSSFHGETFTAGYDLPNGPLMYAESCAAIGLARFTSLMLNASGNGKYADFLERVIFNGVLAGISLSGDRFFYTNYLEVSRNQQLFNFGATTRQPWFECSCCPTNFCRFLPEMLQYIWSVGDNEVRLNIPAANRFQSPFGPLEVSGGYPDDGRITVNIGGGGKFKLAIHVPAWAGTVKFTLNGAGVEAEIQAGYAVFDRQWQAGDKLSYQLPLNVRIIRSHHRIVGNNGKIALMRGPLVYALETADNPEGVFELAIPAGQEFRIQPAAGLPEGVQAICGRAFIDEDVSGGMLYYSGQPGRRETTFTAIPYALWQNRGPAEMCVWMRETGC